MDMTKEYAQIIGKQKSEGKVEEVNDPPRGKEFYTPHKPVVRLGAESTKSKRDLWSISKFQRTSTQSEWLSIPWTAAS